MDNVSLTSSVQRLKREARHLWYEDLTGRRRTNPWIACAKLYFGYCLTRLALNQIGPSAALFGLVAASFEWADGIRANQIETFQYNEKEVRCKKESCIDLHRIRSLVRGIEFAAAISLFRQFKGAVQQRHWLSASGLGLANLFNSSVILIMASRELFKRSQAQEAYLGDPKQGPTAKRYASVYLTKVLKVAGIAPPLADGVPIIPHADESHAMEQQWEKDKDQILQAVTAIANDENCSANKRNNALLLAEPLISLPGFHKIRDSGALELSPDQFGILIRSHVWCHMKQGELQCLKTQFPTDGVLKAQFPKADPTTNFKALRPAALAELVRTKVFSPPSS